MLQMPRSISTGIAPPWDAPRGCIRRQQVNSQPGAQRFIELLGRRALLEACQTVRQAEFLTMADHGAEWDSALVAETSRTPTRLRSQCKKSGGRHMPLDDLRHDVAQAIRALRRGMYRSGSHHLAMLCEAAGRLSRNSRAMELRYG